MQGITHYLFFDKKDVYSEKSIRQTKYYNKKKRLITKKRTKEQRERITRGESPSPRLVKMGATERSKQLVSGAFHVLKSPPISLPPNTPH